MMLIAVLSGFVFSLAAPRLVRIAPGWAGWLIALIPAALIVYFAQFFLSIQSGTGLDFHYGWMPGLGIQLSFYLDGLSFLFALLICGVGVLVFIYSGTYLAGHPQLGLFYSYLLVFMASMLGLVLADNGITLFVFWELTSISSYLLIGFDHKREAARAAALQALLVTGAGGLALLAGLLLMGGIGGTLEISGLSNHGGAIRSHHLYLPILLLILTGAFTKSAQVPFHFWLPNAMEAPTPVSTYLHSATMVKAGVYLLARFWPILGGTEAWTQWIVPVGGATMLTGAYLALVQSDLKRVLAYSTVSALGTLILLIGIGSPAAIKAAMAFLLAHALYKGALFLVAGIIDHEAGTRDAEKLGGLLRAMPLTAFAAALAALSNAGLPPFLGFIGKELMYEATLATPASTLLTATVLLASISFVAVAWIVGIHPFWGRNAALPRKPHEAPFSLWLCPMLPAILGLAAGLRPELVAGPLIAPAVSAIGKQAVSFELVLWHGFDPKLALSAGALLLGLGIYLGRAGFRKLSSRVDYSAIWGPAQWYRLSLKGLESFALFQTRLLQSGHLHYYLLIIIIASFGLVGASLTDLDVPIGLDRWTDVRAYELVLAAIMLLAALVVVLSPSRLTAVVALGVVGYGVALVFLLFSAPDLAMTQFSIETLSVILLVLVIFRLPKFKSYSKPRERLRDAIAALAAGGLITVLVLMATALQREARLVSYFAENSLLLAKGRNVVNVILVDFRGFDTLGEITVLSVAAIGVYSLLKLRSKGSSN